ncbi:uncharacterized protein UTRI_01649 [Ustilago trichophora]|uniref:PHD-type domain-containing protein n=1 Tax=Ustilago trichophora TaxID=86804 RepID=A0A5C3E089_9BASI|nr:uncharacterized protein UTRI_01649 [Ustilago trichophora]
MTPTGLVSTTTTSRSSNWFELAVKAKAASLREAQRKMSTPASLPTEAQVEEQAGSSSKAEDSAAALEDVEMQAPQGPASGSAPSPSPAVTITASSEPIEPTETQPADAVAAQAPSPLAGGLVGASSSKASDTRSAQNIATAAATAVTQPPTIAALLTPNTSRNVPLEGDELRTEVMGPPPTLPADPAYPPLNPALTDVPLQPPNPKRRGPSTAANGTQRKPAPPQAPADFVPPVNANGKMPFVLFQTLKKTPAESSKSSTDAHRSQSEATSGDVADTTKPADAPRELSAPAESNVVDPLLADVLTDAESVATATATRETSPAASLALDSIAQIPAEAPAPAPAQSPAPASRAATPSKPTAAGALLSTPSAAITGEIVEASPSAALRRNPSNRGASLQASQSITNAYADPMGLKKHRESLLQDEARARRSPSVSSTGGAPTQATTPTPAGSKKGNAARTIVPPPLVEPPPGMMYTLEGRLRTIPGIAGAIVPAGPSSTSIDTNLTPRLEDKGTANNDFCETCGGHGRFVCCDGCPRSFHFFCMSPPLDIDEMPASNAAEVLGPAKANAAQKGNGKAGSAEAELNMDEMWFCSVCVAERKPKAASKPKGLGPFGYLLPVLSRQNPKSFQLPADVRTYFKDVATANDGDYINGAMVRPVKPNKHGQIEARDPYRLKDKNGDAVLCFRCGGTALPSESEQGGAASKLRTSGVSKAGLNDAFGHVAASTPAEHTIREGTGWRKIISCDFCLLHWHIDCVDPPMLGMPSNLRKWMCPAHSDHVNDRRRVARIGTAVPKTLDLPIPSAKTIGPGKHFRTRVLNNGDIDIIPDPMEELMGANGITGSLQSGVKEISVVPGVTDAPSVTAGGTRLASKIRYRFPEKVIRTDFWSKLRADDSSKIGSVFYIAADEIAGRVPTRLVAVEEGVTPDESRYRPFGKREYPLSGLDALADIAATRLIADDLAGGEVEDLCFKRPSKTRQLIATALGIDLQNQDVPESNLRSSLDAPESSDSSTLSPLSSLSESESEVSPAPAPAPAPATVPAPAPPGPATQPVAPPAPAATAPALSEEELIKQIALEAASGVSSGDPIRLSKRKAAVAAESAIAGSPNNTPNKKLRSISPAVTAATSTPASKSHTVPVEVRSKKITLKANGNATKHKQEKDKHSEQSSESQIALRTAYHLTEQYEEERKEIQQLRAIKELMRLKGHRRMLEFLLSPNSDDDEEEHSKSGSS